MSKTAIQFDGVGKLYQLGTVGTGTLSHDLNRWWQTKILRHEDPYLKIGETNDRSKKGSSNFVWALKDITFDVEEGDVVGIIGKNGAGKSTLLKLLSRVTSPTTGVIRAKGRIASLLEVGTGFHPEMTGRENIYMNGSILGMTRAEITRKLDEIVDFAGVERYLDTPTKRYSSGMMVRLGFAVAAFLEPEILVVDEVLAVGDAEFQKKAIGKMQDVSKGEGRTVLFVSHNMGSVRALCNHGIVLKNGGIDFIGDIDNAITRYVSQTTEIDTTKIIERIGFTRDHLKITKIEINGTESSESIITQNQDKLEVIVEGETTEEIYGDLRLIFKTMTDIPMGAAFDGRYTTKRLTIKPGKFTIRKVIQLPKYMGKGDYLIDMFLYKPLTIEYFHAYRCAKLQCEGNYDEYSRPLLLPNEGIVGLETISTEIIQ